VFCTRGRYWCHLSPRQERRLNQVNPITAGPHLRLVWPQWQGAGTESVRSLAPEFPFDIARRGYSVGTKVLQAVLPEHDGPTAIVPVEMGDIGLDERDGIEAKAVVFQQLRSALAIIQEHEPARITTVGGECSVSMAPFSYLINMHGDDLAILWIDSHPDMGTGETAYPGFHAMVVSALTGTATRSSSRYCRPRRPPIESRSSACMTGPTRRCRQSPASGV
jgi:arginase